MVHLGVSISSSDELTRKGGMDHMGVGGWGGVANARRERCFPPLGGLLILACYFSLCCRREDLLLFRETGNGYWYMMLAVLCTRTMWYKFCSFFAVVLCKFFVVGRECVWVWGGAMRRVS